MTFNFRHRPGYIQHHFENNMRSTESGRVKPSSFKEPTRTWRLRSGAGYTLIEISVVMVITGVLLSLVLANYRRSSEDSVLQREASLIGSRIRLAQEETAAGQIQKFCHHYIGNACENGCDARPEGEYHVCEDQAESGGTHIPETPQGGFGMVFGCQPNGGTNDPLVVRGKGSYFLLADNRKCPVDILDSECFPLNIDDMDTTDLGTDSDGLFSLNKRSEGFYKGDTLQKEYVVDTQVEIKDLKIVATSDVTSGVLSYSCGYKPDGELLVMNPWSNKKEPITGSMVPNHYPIQIALRFAPPDGRGLKISDNVSEFPPAPVQQGGTTVQDTDNPWKEAHIMLGLKKRNTDCRVVKVTSNNVVSQYIDADCNITTSN